MLCISYTGWSAGNKKMLYLVGIFLAACLLSSCVKEVEIEPQPYNRKVVVDGFIENGRYAQVFLTMSTPFLDEYDSVSIRKSFLNQAKVILRSSLGEEEVLTLFMRDSFFPPFVYRSVNIRGMVGVEYSLEIEVAGRKVYASTTIPQPPIIWNTRFTYVTDSTGYPEYMISLRSDAVQYVYTRVQSVFADENLHPVREGSIRLDAGNEFGWISVYRVKERRISAGSNYDNFYKEYPPLQYDHRDRVLIVPGTVDSISHEIINSLFDDWGSNDNPFRFNDSGIKSNIEGGIGLWIGIGVNNAFVVSGEVPKE